MVQDPWGRKAGGVTAFRGGRARGIDRAIGIVMAHQGGSPERAFGVLRKVSNDRNAKLRQVAAEMVRADRRGGPMPRRARPADGG